MLEWVKNLNTKLGLEVVGLMASLIAVLTFFSIKPLPLVEMNIVIASERDSSNFNPDLDYGIAMFEGSRCHLTSSDDNFSDFQAYLGTVIYIKLLISADGSGAEPDWVQAAPEGCSLNYANLKDHGGFTRAPDGSPKYFSHYIGSNIAHNEDGSTYHSIPEFILPLLPEHGLEVGHCDSSCFEIEGPVRIMKRNASEGITSFLFEPVDTYKNSYLTSRYECRLAVESSGWALFAPVYCSFL